MIKAILPAALLLLWCISVFAAMIGGVLTAILLVGLWFDLSLWPEFVSLFAVTTILIALTTWIFDNYYNDGATEQPEEKEE